MTAKQLFHINEEGNVLRCSTTPEKCRFGKNNPHFDTKDEAQMYYEKTQKKIL